MSVSGYRIFSYLFNNNKESLAPPLPAAGLFIALLSPAASSRGAFYWLGFSGSLARTLHEIARGH